MKNYFAFAFLFLFTACTWKTTSDAGRTYPEHLDIVADMHKYSESLKENPEYQMVDLETFIPGIQLDIRYATRDNFTAEVIYTAPKAFARIAVAEALRQVQDSLLQLGLELLIYDAYRPYSASVRFFEVYPDTNFVANPANGSRHNRGCAIDLTLIRLADGIEIEMPSAFDDFSEKAHPDFGEISEAAKANRTFLFSIMQHFGFSHYPTEWWHFDYGGWESYPLMDLGFEEILKQPIN
jgi:zinc D-Ala-D-Ala dipeptidase